MLYIFGKFYVARNSTRDPTIRYRYNDSRETPHISLATKSVHIWGTYNLEDIVTFSVGGKRAGKWQRRAVFAPTLIPFAGRKI